MLPIRADISLVRINSYKYYEYENLINIRKKNYSILYVYT